MLKRLHNYRNNVFNSYKLIYIQKRICYCHKDARKFSFAETHRLYESVSMFETSLSMKLNMGNKSDLRKPAYLQNMILPYSFSHLHITKIKHNKQDELYNSTYSQKLKLFSF